MAMSAQARRQQRDAQVVRLHRAGWSLRRIGRDPRVQLSAQGVADVLDRARSGGRAADGLVLTWYRRGIVDGDPDARLYWDTYKARVAQLMAAAAPRLGAALDDLDLVAREGLRRKAGATAAAELVNVTPA